MSPVSRPGGMPFVIEEVLHAIVPNRKDESLAVLWGVGFTLDGDVRKVGCPLRGLGRTWAKGGSPPRALLRRAAVRTLQHSNSPLWVERAGLVLE